MKSYINLTINGFLLVSLAACNSNQTDKTDSGIDSTALRSDTALLDTPMTTGSGADTFKQKLKEGEDGTGKPSTDPRTRKQQ